MRHARATDSNENEIMNYLEAHGCQVVRIGEPLDLLIGYRGIWTLCEIKSSDTHSLQRGQIEFLSTAKAPVGVATTPDEAFDLAQHQRHVLALLHKDRLTQWLIRNPEQTKLSVRQFRLIISGEK